MAKAKEITGLDCAADALEWAAEVLRVRFDEVIALREAALDFSDIEGVHSMRVATRRLRSALRDFMPLMKKHRLQNAREDLKEIAAALGAVRDHDVAIVALETLQIKAKSALINDGIGVLIEERRRQREDARRNLAKTLDRDRLDRIQKRFQNALTKAVKPGKSADRISFNKAGRDLTADGWRELQQLGSSLYAPFRVEEIHEMRIAAKRLRYAIELFVACWGEKISPFANEISKMQTFLGELHDCDVWIEELGARLQNSLQNGKESENDYQSATWLLSEFVKKRTKEYFAALKLWNEWQTNDFAGRMQKAIQDA